MSASILATKLYIPPTRSRAVLRPRLIERMNKSLDQRLTLISAPAGFGKTTLVSEWVTDNKRRAAWLSLDEGDSDPTRFLMYLVATLQTITPAIGTVAFGMLQSPQPLPAESILTALLNDIAIIPDDCVLVIDDYHIIDARPIDNAVEFLIEHLPPRMHLVIATREDPHLPLTRLRARGQLTELRAADLRFTPAEAAEFLNQVMGLNLSLEDVTALEARTEGWIAGLQLAGISLQGHSDATDFIESFTGSHHFVVDYLVEEVLRQQPEDIQTFLLRTSVLDRLCGSLCDAVLDAPSVSGQDTLEFLERANLFIVPLDNERRWYRYHHLFAELLRQRLYQSGAQPGADEAPAAALHRRASQWYEDNDLPIEAFHHAVAAHDIDRAARLVEGNGMPLQFRGGLTPVLHWLHTLPAAALDARPSLWVMYASALSMAGRLAEVESRLQAAEAALNGAVEDAETRNLTGHIAAIRALLAAFDNQPEIIIAQSQRALEYLHPNNVAVRAATIWKLGIAYHLQGDRAAAGRAYREAISISQASRNIIVQMSASSGLAQVQEAENQLPIAAQTYRDVLKLAGDVHLWAACEAHLGLARISYEWNDLEAAEQHSQQSMHLARQLGTTDRPVACNVLDARLRLARGDVAGADAVLAEADHLVRQNRFVLLAPDVTAARVLVLLRQGDLDGAARLAESIDLPLSQARVFLAQGSIPAALTMLASYRDLMEAKGWVDERLKAMVMQAVATRAYNEQDAAAQILADALLLAQPGGFVRIFVDEGEPMKRLLLEAVPRGIVPDHARRLLAAFSYEETKQPAQAPGIGPLTERELEVLRLIAEGLSNQEISERLFLALNTVKGHNQIIFDKLGVQRRTEAVARARELGLL